MARLKRKADDTVDAEAPPAKKGARAPKTRKSKQHVEPTASSSRPSRSLRKTAVEESISTNGTPKKPAKKVLKKVQTNSAPATTEEKNTQTSGRRQSVISIEVSTKKERDEHDDHEADEDPNGPSYWLMKAEPESRMEKGKDVKFSIDDLKAATTPEGWDGVRNAVARNNMRMMMKGDLAFFYHSNCKVPGIVGTMEIVREHSIDETAFDPEHPYYDEKSDREKPKWCLVHVEFRQKFPVIIKLKDLQKFSKDGGVLENMQTLRQSRLSVSKVLKKEWDFIMSLVDMGDAGAASAQNQQQVAG